MKKTLLKISVAVITSSLLLLTSCNDKKTQTSTSSTSSTDTGFVQTSDNSVKQTSSKYSKTSSVMLYDGWTLCVENEDGKMIPSEETTSGTEVNILMENNEIVAKKAIRRLRDGKEDTFDFVLIDMDGKEYWTRDIFVAKDGIPAIVTANEARLYSSPDLASVTKKTIKRGEMIAFSDEVDDFEKVYIYNGTPFGKEFYVKKDSVSTDESSIDNIKTFKRLADLGEAIDPKVNAEVRSIIEN